MNYQSRMEANTESDHVQTYVPQENGMAKMGDVLYMEMSKKWREFMGQLNTEELTQGQVKELYAKAQEQTIELEQPTQEAEPDKDTFTIYQLKGGDATRNYRFEPYDYIQAAGLAVDPANYANIYTAPLESGMSIEGIFERFNIDHPKDFKGHSLSISDVVVLHQNGQDTAHYVDSGAGFRQVPEFLQSTRSLNPLETAEKSTEQNYNIIDGQINNTTTVAELEAKVKAGEQISLAELAGAIKTDKERGKEAKLEKESSIRAQLKADKERVTKKPTKSKLQDLERS